MTALLLLALSLGLAGCGYRLRGSDIPPLTIRDIVLDAPQPEGDLTRMVRRQLRTAGVRVLSREQFDRQNDEQTEAQSETRTDEQTETETVTPVLQLGRELQQSRPVSVSTRVDTAQYELILAVRLSLHQGDETPPFTQTLSVERAHTETIDLIVGNQEEMEIILLEMRRDLVDQILRMLEAAT